MGHCIGLLSGWYSGIWNPTLPAVLPPVVPPRQAERLYREPSPPADRRSTPPRGRATPTTSRDKRLPATLSSAQIARIVHRALPTLIKCGRRTGDRGRLSAVLTIGGATGRVSKVTVRGLFHGSATGNCVSHHLRSLRFPRFRATEQTAPVLILLR